MLLRTAYLCLEIKNVSDAWRIFSAYTLSRSFAINVL